MFVRSGHIPVKAIGLLACIVGSAIAVGAVPQSGSPSVTKVEPPSWWARHSVNPVRLLVRGKNLHGARVRATKRGIQSSNVIVNNDGTYLFVNFKIDPAARPGTYPIVVESARGKATIPFTINAPLSDSGHFQGITRDDVIYLIMPDRFADGDRTMLPWMLRRQQTTERIPVLIMEATSGASSTNCNTSKTWA